MMDKYTYNTLLRRQIDNVPSYSFNLCEGSTFIDILRKKPIMRLGTGIVYDYVPITSIDYTFLSDDFKKLINEISIVFNSIKGNVLYNKDLYTICDVATADGNLNVFTGERECYYRIPSKIFKSLLVKAYEEDESLLNTVNFLAKIVYDRECDVIRELICECGNVYSTLRKQIGLEKENYFNKFIYDRKFDEVLLCKKSLSQLIDKKYYMKRYYDYFRSNIVHYDEKTKTDTFVFQFKLSSDVMETTNGKSSIIEHIGIDEFNSIYKETEGNLNKLINKLIEKYSEYMSEFTDKQICKTKIIVDDTVTVKVKYK